MRDKQYIVTCSNTHEVVTTSRLKRARQVARAWSRDGRQGVTVRVTRGPDRDGVTHYVVVND